MGRLTLTSGGGSELVGFGEVAQPSTPPNSSTASHLLAVRLSIYRSRKEKSKKIQDMPGRPSLERTSRRGGRSGQKTDRWRLVRRRKRRRPGWLRQQRGFGRYYVVCAACPGGGIWN